MKPIKKDETFDTHRKGDLAEHYAITWLWNKGYEVFMNSGCSGPADIAVMDSEGKTILIDVKTASPTPTLSNPHSVTIRHGRTKLQRKLGVRILLFNPLNRELRFVNHESPNQYTNNKEGEIKSESH